MGMDIQTIDLPTGVTLEYTLTGPEQGELLCFVHGASANLRQFAGQRAHFEARYRVLLLSLRGHGRSSPAQQPSLASYSCAALARDVLALWDALGLARAHVVGNSLGGLVGYALLGLAPDRLLTLTTFGTTAALRYPPALAWMIVALLRLLGPHKMAWLFARTSSKDRQVARLVGEMCRLADPDALVLVTQTIARYDYTPILREQTLPMLLVRGEFDRDVNQNLRSTLAALEQTPQFSLVELPGAGHFANLEQPEAFNQILAGFLDRLNPCG